MCTLLGTLLLLPFLSVVLFAAGEGDDISAKMEEVLRDDNIRNTWQPHILEMCLDPELTPIHRPPSARLYCYYHQNILHSAFEFIKVEVLNRRPAIIRLPDFLPPSKMASIEALVAGNGSLEEMGVEGLHYSPGHRGRKADGLWLDHTEKVSRLHWHIISINPLPC